jgi:hypothetical protein
MLVQKSEKAPTIDISRRPKHPARALMNEVFFIVHKYLCDLESVVDLFLFENKVRRR